MKEIPPVKAVMTPFPYSIGIDEPIARASSMMEEKGIRHLAVVEQGRLVGVLTDRDIKRALDGSLGLAAEGQQRVGDVFVREAYVVERTEPLDTVLQHMARNQIDSALVVRGDKLVGIFTVADACRSFAEFLRSFFPRGGGDNAA